MYVHLHMPSSLSSCDKAQGKRLASNKRYCWRKSVSKQVTSEKKLSYQQSWHIKQQQASAPVDTEVFDKVQSLFSPIFLFSSRRNGERKRKIEREGRRPSCKKMGLNEPVWLGCPLPVRGVTMVTSVRDEWPRVPDRPASWRLLPQSNHTSSSRAGTGSRLLPHCLSAHTQLPSPRPDAYVCCIYSCQGWKSFLTDASKHIYCIFGIT